jgi:aminotransferase
MADITPFGFTDDVTLARHLVVEHGLAVVPGSSFYPPGSPPRQRIRFSFPKRPETLRAAAERLNDFARARGVV